MNTIKEFEAKIVNIKAGQKWEIFINNPIAIPVKAVWPNVSPISENLFRTTNTPREEAANDIMIPAINARWIKPYSNNAITDSTKNNLNPINLKNQEWELWDIIPTGWL